MSTPAVTPSPAAVGPSPTSLDPGQYAEFLKAQIAAQSNTTGLTQQGPNMGGASMPPSTLPTPQQPSSPQQSRSFGPGQKGAHQVQSMQNMVKAAQSTAGQINQYVQQKKQREYEQTIGRFTAATQGVSQAQAQVQQGQEMLKKGASLLQSDPEQAHQLITQGQQLTQQGQTALKQNQTILNDMANDSKSHKVITKAFGIDDKNADSPERKAAAQVLGKQMGINQQASAILSQLPQTQQLSPQGQAQQLARQSGVVGAPATQGQLIGAATQMEKTTQQETGKNVRATAREEATLALHGQKLDASGKPTPMTPEEIAANPILNSQQQAIAARTDVQHAQAELDRARASAQPEMIKIAEGKLAIAQGNLGMRQREFGIKVQEEERKQLETANKIGLEETLTTPEGGTITLPGGRPLQSWAQQTVVTAQDRLQQVNSLMQRLEPLKDNNQAGYLAMDRLGYAMGFASDKGELGSEISNIELQRVVNAATILKGSSRAYAALTQAMIHTPNAFTDSPKLMYQKLQTIQKNLTDMQQDAINYGQKNQPSNTMPGRAPQAPPPKAKPSTTDPLGIF